jgi:uncharacterized membrane protein YphA (DoxX/SURF4 family)
MLASTFVTGGLDTLRHPAPEVPAADPVVGGLAQWLPSGVSTKQVVLADGALKVAAGGLLAFGRFPRLSALALAGSLVPTTIAGHPFWKESDPAKRRQQRVHFTKNVSMLGVALADRDRSLDDRGQQDRHGPPARPSSPPWCAAVLAATRPSRSSGSCPHVRRPASPAPTHSTGPVTPTA